MPEKPADDDGITLCGGCGFPSDEDVESFGDWVMTTADMAALLNRDYTREIEIWCPSCQKEGLHLRA